MVNKIKMGLMALVAGVAGFVNSADGDNTEKGAIKFNSSPSVASGPDLVLMHWPGATEGFDSPTERMYPYELYNGARVIDFYWNMPFSPPHDKLMQEGRAPESMTTFTGILSGRLLPAEGETTEIDVDIPYPDNYEYKRPIVDLYTLKNTKISMSLINQNRIHYFCSILYKKLLFFTFEHYDFIVLL